MGIVVETAAGRIGLRKPFEPADGTRNSQKHLPEALEMEEVGVLSLSLYTATRQEKEYIGIRRNPIALLMNYD